MTADINNSAIGSTYVEEEKRGTSHLICPSPTPCFKRKYIRARKKTATVKVFNYIVFQHWIISHAIFHCLFELCAILFSPSLLLLPIISRDFIRVKILHNGMQSTSTIERDYTPQAIFRAESLLLHNLLAPISSKL